MIKFTFAIILLTPFASFVSAQSTQAEKQKIDTIVAHAAQSFIKSNSGCAFSAGVITNGRTYLFNYGTVEKGSNQIPSNQSLYEIGSITKTFTSIILAHAVLEKKVNPTDDIRKYLPGRYPNLEFAGKPIQLIQLVNLTSGLPNNMPDNPAYRTMSSDSMPFAIVSLHTGYNKSKFMQDLHQVKLDTAPGLLPRHSNAAAQLLAYILENIYHQPLAQLLKIYITQPLKMPHTFLNISDDKKKYLIKGYNEKGSLMPYIPAYDVVAGGMKSSIADMTRYIEFHLEEKDPAVKLTHTVAWGNINGFALGWNWFMDKTGNGKLKIFDDGTTFGFTADILLYPEQKFGVILLTNECDQNSNNRLGRLADKIYEESNYTLAERSSLDFGFSPSIKTLLQQLNRQGFDHAVQVAADLKKNNQQFILQENEINAWGYFLLEKGKKQEALEIFKLNINLYPESANTYDSLAETYDNVGDKASAVKYYKRSLELNPQNEHAIAELKKLQ